jgi:hypothetical protein
MGRAEASQREITAAFRPSAHATVPAAKAKSAALRLALSDLAQYLGAVLAE